LSALGTAWGDRLQSLTLEGVHLAPSFFPAVVQQLPGLQFLNLPRIPDSEGPDDMAARFMALCSRLTRPLKLAVPSEIHK
jgi:hypothetical protein